MDTLIFTDTVAYQRKKADYANALSTVQAVVNAFNAMPGIANLATSEMNQAFNDPDGLIFDKLTSGTPVVIGGITLDKSKAMSIMVQPAGYSAFIAAIAIAKEVFPNYRIGFNNPQSYFEIDGSNAVQISAALDAQLLEGAKYYTRCVRAEKEKAFADAVISALTNNDIASFYRGTGWDIGTFVNRVVSKQFTVNHKRLNAYTTEMADGEINRHTDSQAYEM